MGSHAENRAWFVTIFSWLTHQITPKFPQVFLFHVLGWSHKTRTLRLFCQLYQSCIIPLKDVTFLFVWKSLFIPILKFSTDPLRMTSQAQISPLNEVNEELLLAEGRAQRVHACTFPLFDIKDGGNARGYPHLSYYLWKVHKSQFFSQGPVAFHTRLLWSKQTTLLFFTFLYRRIGTVELLLDWNNIF